MTIRPLRTDDIPLLEAMAADTGYEYLDLRGPHVQAVQVVEDEHGDIVAAAAAETIVQLYLWSSRNHRPVTKLGAIRMLHQGMAEELRNLGYSETNVFLPPKIEKTFGRRMEKSFGWKWNWRSLYLKF